MFKDPLKAQPLTSVRVYDQIV